MACCEGTGGLETMGKIGFGVEIECYGMSGNTMQECTVTAGAGEIESLTNWHGDSRVYRREEGGGWKIQTDGSLHGQREGTWSQTGALELISPVLYGIEDGEKEMTAVLKELRKGGAWVDRNCGTHITIGIDRMARFNRMSGAKKQQVMLRIAEIYNHFQPCFDNLSPNCRRSEENPDCLGLIDMDDPSYDRYQFLNLSNFVMRGCVEFRQPGFTLEAKKLKGWLRLGHAIIKVAMNEAHPSHGKALWDDETPRDSLKAMLDFLKPGVRTNRWAVERQNELITNYTHYRAKRQHGLRGWA